MDLTNSEKAVMDARNALETLCRSLTYGMVGEDRVQVSIQAIEMLILEYIESVRMSLILEDSVHTLTKKIDKAIGT